MRMQTALLKSLAGFFTLIMILTSCASPQNIPQTFTPTVALVSPLPTQLTETPIPTSTHTPVPSPTRQTKIYLSDLNPVSATIGWADLGRGVYPSMLDANKAGKTLRTHGIVYRHGLFAHAPSQLLYSLARKYSSFDAQISLQSDVNCGDGVIFQVTVDDRLVYESEPVTPRASPQSIHLDILGAQSITLSSSVRSAGDCDWAIWGDPVLTLADHAALAVLTQTPPTPDPNLPCSDSLAEHSYLFLDCSDIRRVRLQVTTGAPETLTAWFQIKTTISNYRRELPTQYDTQKSFGTLWWGRGNYVMRDMGLLYLVTGDESIAADILQILDLVIRNTPPGKVLARIGHGEVLVQSVTFGYLSVRDNGLITEDRRNFYDQFFIQQAQLYEMEAINKGNRTPLDSWINRNTIFGANISAASIALAFPDNPTMQRLIQRVVPHLEWQIGQWWEVDGGWGENTESYGSRVMEGLLLFAEILRKTGGENWFEREFNGRSINLICSYFLKIMTPEGDVIALNDSNYEAVDPGIFLLCGERTQDPRLLFAYQRYLEGLKVAFGHDNSMNHTPFEIVAWAGLGELSPSIPEYTSLELPETGVNILRTGWQSQDQYIAIQYTQSRVHQEAAYANLFLYDRGPWIVGNGYFLPDWSAQTGYPTDQHSTLALDNQDQSPPGGQSVAFADLWHLGISAVSHRSYSNLDHSRMLLWIKPWHQWIVVDDAVVLDRARHTLQLRWFVRGHGAETQENQWFFTRSANTDRLNLTLLPGTEASYQEIERAYPAFKWIVNAEGVQMDVPYPGRPIRLVTDINNTASGEPLPVVTRKDEEGGTQVASTLGETTWQWLLPPVGQTQGQIGMYSLQGEVGCVKLEPDVLSGYCLMNGSGLFRNGQSLVDADTNLYLESDFKSGTLQVFALENTSLTFYWTTPVTGIQEDGGEIPFTRVESLITITLSPGMHLLSIN